MKKFIIVLILMVAPGISTASQDIDKAELIGGLLQEFGIASLLKEMPEIIADGLVQRRKEKGDLTPEQYKQVSQILSDEFNPNEMSKRVIDILSQDFDATLFSSVKQVISSPKAKEMLKLKQGAATPQAFTEIKEIAKEHAKNPVDKDKLELLKQLDDVSAETEFFVAVQALAVNAILQAMDGLKHKAPAEKEGKEGQYLNAIYQDLLRPSQYTTMMTFLYTFKDKTNEDMVEYIQIYRMRNVQWFLRKSMDALTAAARQTSKDAETKIAGLKL